MLTLSPSAADAVTGLLSQRSDSPTAGIRIDGDAPEYAVTLVPAPAADDVVIEQSGARVYLTDSAAAGLSDRVLDARVNEAGALSFTLGVQTDS
jgi:Fe-S cluster assembly iron-binding protein IscA